MNKKIYFLIVLMGQHILLNGGKKKRTKARQDKKASIYKKGPKKTIDTKKKAFFPPVWPAVLLALQPAPKLPPLTPSIPKEQMGCFILNNLSLSKFPLSVVKNSRRLSQKFRQTILENFEQEL